MTEPRPKERAMSIRGIPEDAYERLRRQAAQHQKSMEAEVRDMIVEKTKDPDAGEPGMLGTRIHQLFAEVGGFDEFEPPPRTDQAREVDFSEW